jgi:cell division protease FtsH
VVGHVLKHTDPVHKVSIIARGLAGGYTLALPQDDRTLISRNKFLDDLAFTLGGRAAEELVFDDITSGAANDIERVTQMARNMVTRLGMSDDLGPLVYGKRDELIFLGREISEQRDYSEAVAEEIDQEVRALINGAYERAKNVLIQYRTKLDEIAERLLEVETLSRDQFEEIFPPVVEKKGGTPVLREPALNSSTL